MTSNTKTPEEYIDELPEARRTPIKKLRKKIKETLPRGFEESMSYGMITYQVPLSIYAAGYHAGKGKTPLPFISLASQKNYIALYHSGLYANRALLAWFKEEYSSHALSKLDMGKSCVRFKKMDDIPYKLIAQLCGKISVEEWIEIYEKQIKR